ncbi:lycopene cyclase family protein [Kitasatospora cineracea]|uniref:Lycopene beta-cyclase n=1 Tax=Kitasatospora cineracea TaxID=88074 RepID=A0A3N4S1L2_9ACTN|nr:lycopene cyclase family protein [Kitasatospora cineracea]RPE37109.1 lycopene beta-cyclase [Kitasatospora cineracea]
MRSDKEGEPLALVIIGGGAAGLSLADWLVRYDREELGPGSRFDVTVIEAPEGPLRPAARTWCFWDDGPGAYEEAVTAQWSRLRITGPDGERVEAVPGPSRYRMVRSTSFEELVRARLAAHPRARVLRATVRRVQARPDGRPGVRVHADDPAGLPFVLDARYAFDSRPPAGLPPARTVLLQHFRGWFVRTDRPRFDTGSADLMDFRVPQPAHGLAFGYVLPLAPDRALVEYTEFSRRLLTVPAYERALRAYTGEVLGLGGFAVEDVEQGAIPMTDGRFARRTSPAHVHIGTAGGATRPATGYTFAAVQRQGRAIAAALSRPGTPHRPAPAPAPHRRRALAMDAVLLRALDTGRVDGPRFFTDLFRRTPTEQVLRFLDGTSTPLEELRIGLRCPVGPMLRSAAELPFLPRRAAPGIRPAHPANSREDHR